MVSIVYVLLLFANFFIKCLHEFLFYAKLKLIQEFIKNTPRVDVVPFGTWLNYLFEQACLWCLFGSILEWFRYEWFIKTER